MGRSLTVVVITYNEAHHIQACLESVAFAQEILVLDSGSTDETVALAQQYTPHVWGVDWPGDGPQRNRGIEKATGDWILCLDADERVSPALAQELKSLTASQESTAHGGFSIPFQSHYLGRAIRFGDWRAERHIRLFRRGFGHYSSSTVYGAQGAHCKPEIEGSVGRLQHPILHYPYPDLETVLRKVNQYSSGGAALRHRLGQKSSLAKALLKGLWTFIRGYFLKAGFLDGKEGLLLAISNAEGTYYRYLKLMYLS